jgi:hypothetical protein
MPEHSAIPRTATPPSLGSITRWRTDPRLRTARDEVRDQGWAVLRDLPFLHRGQARESVALAIASAFGVPSGRDGGQHVWPVRPDPGGESDTFSGTAGAAGFHTDAQYHQVPEGFVCLFAVRPADSGGHTRVLSARDAAAAINRLPDSERAFRLLSEPRWHWRTPRDFTTPEPGHGSRLTAPVLPGDGTIRWRGDNLSMRTPRAHRGIAPVVDRCLDAADGAQTLALQAGDLVVLDNLRALHGRTEFDDTRRLLLRIRLWSS